MLVQLEFMFVFDYPHNNQTECSGGDYGVNDDLEVKSWKEEEEEWCCLGHGHGTGK